MNNSLILDQTSLKRIPSLFVFILILVLGLPAVALNYFGVDFSAIVKNLGYDYQIPKALIESQVRGYFRQTLLQWSAFSLAAITVLLTLTQYRLAKDTIALVIGLSILFSGTVDALSTLTLDGLSPYFTNKDRIDAVIWTVSNSISGLILLIGLLMILHEDNEKKVKMLTIYLLNTLLFIGAFSLIYYTVTSLNLPKMWFRDSILSRPYESLYLIIYMIIVLFVYPKLYKKFPYILVNCIFYMSITQIVMAIYLMILSTAPYDSAYNIAYFLKIVVYFIPFACLIVNYVFSYNTVLEAQRKLKISERKLQYLASHDVLTELYNRREFENFLNRSISNCSREQASFALFVCDIDNFKLINDTLGHTIGDRFLQKFSAKLMHLSRQGEILSRIGGDEFTLITSKISSSSDARRLAERMITTLNTPYPIEGKLITSTISIGIAIYPSDGETAENLLKCADAAMYIAKKSGKNTYQFYSENLSAQQLRESQIESFLRDALKKEEFTLVYQPKYNLVTEKIIGVEALIRWHNETLGDVSPEEFIPVAERSGLIIKIENWVLTKFCAQVQEWLEKYNHSMVFAINVSASQFENHDFFATLAKTLKEHNIPANNFEIEISEQILMISNPQINENLHKIDRLGVNILIDDFGMGHSSLTHLKSLPIRVLKIDKSFISDVHNDFEKVVVIDTIIKLAQELEMNVIAEGIESQEQINYLISKKCYVGQGFFLSKPLSAEKFERLAFQ